MSNSLGLPVDDNVNNMGVEEVTWTYPWVVESNPVFHPVAKLLKAQVSKIIEMIDDANILPATIFFL